MNKPNPNSPSRFQYIRPGVFITDRFRRAIFTSQMLLWAGIVTIPVGTFLQQNSPQYETYFKKTLEEIQRERPDAETGPAMFVGRALAIPASICFSTLIFVMFMSLFVFIHFLCRLNRFLGLIVASVFCLGCSLGAVLGFQNAWNSMSWGFIVLGFGYSSAALGLIFGGFCGLIMCLTLRGNDNLRKPCTDRLR